MNSINCTLLGDGSSDKMLVPAIKWLLVEHYPEIAFNFESTPPIRNQSLEKKICIALDLFPCHILFLQRDTEKEDYHKRLTEIQKGIENADCDLPKIVPVIPKRMSEAWLLINEYAIRRASGNINGKIPLNLPKISRLESIVDPKQELKNLIKQASELSKRRLKTLNLHAAIHRVADSIEDYSSLRTLSAFSALEEEIKNLNLAETQNF